MLGVEYHRCYVTGDLDKMMGFCDFPLDYFDRGECGRDFVRTEWERYFRKWRKREVQVESTSTDPDPRENNEVTTRIRYHYRWVHRDGNTMTGRAESIIEWYRSGGTWRIRGVNETTYPD